MSSSLTGAFGGGFRRAADADATVSSRSAWRTRLAALWWVGLLAGSVWLALAALTIGLPENGDFPYSTTFGHGTGLIGAALLLASPFLPALGRVGARLRHWGPWTVALALAFTVWELATAKFEWLPMPFFPPPQAILEVFAEDWPKLGGSIVNSLILLSGRLPHRCRGRLRSRCGGGLVADGRLLGPSGPALRRTAPGHRLAAAGLLSCSPRPGRRARSSWLWRRVSR